MQRRRRKKAAPKNVFGSASQSPQKSQLNKTARTPTPRSRTQIAPPPSVPGAKPKPKPKVVPVKAPIEVAVEPIVEPIVEPQSIPIEDDSADAEKHEEDVLEEPLLGGTKRKDIGLDEKTKQVQPKQPPVDSGKSLKARQIIQDSMLKASLAVEAARSQKLIDAIKPAVTKEAPKKPQRKFRKKPSYQPANRARRLDRSRHMEYKYEMRGLLVDIGIAEEHHSNLLAIIWARGERQTTKEAKKFLDEKLGEGIIDEEQMSSLEKIVESYTVRR